jgi:hypothetical protein
VSRRPAPPQRDSAGDLGPARARWSGSPIAGWRRWRTGPARRRPRLDVAQALQELGRLAEGGGDLEGAGTGVLQRGPLVLDVAQESEMWPAPDQVK